MKKILISLLVIIAISIYYKFVFLENTIEGNWQWLRPTHHEHILEKNNDAICGNEIAGKWKKVNNNQIYIINWKNIWLDKVLLFHDLLIGFNSNNKIVIAYRIKNNI